MSQIEVTSAIIDVASKIQGEGLDFVINTLEYVQNTIKAEPYSKKVAEDELKMRWTRTADEILSDGYIYQTKGCTDLVILFQTLCEAKGYTTNFLRVKDKSGVANHSMAEVQIDRKWYTVDAGNSFQIKKGKLNNEELFRGYALWKRGRDGWDIGLKPKK